MHEKVGKPPTEKQTLNNTPRTTSNLLAGVARGPAGHRCHVGPATPVVRFPLGVARQVGTRDRGAAASDAKGGTGIVGASHCGPVGGPAGVTGVRTDSFRLRSLTPIFLSGGGGIHELTRQIFLFVPEGFGIVR
eukprot:CAMPEP_0194310832 /NCGR_PEP_ID=MMETSP0171-20130528/7818_1 /TAXON_ID=218684 /ORGANISM="Corethron pennatum, Strain L29A3" /LENGTH=133 /DNA_ID=CAMNT_0039064661 /DNA_START=126 /DNA_END=524 /DNA_ORIENTATION=-